ncbi:predicted protein [Uncinocarpus reesii 1704]|uniref:Separase n=1 Tax=Uncinocarpus reesii (strain UAMH 1704) TaxID=336963 RepID=C4JJS8_UNCRE|nr:uncharacterized protein UREG_01885 [Uncinocarpus reesii 1704]EEP77036.1 predicted protein [Uncinocarpus reesii 1704]
MSKLPSGSLVDTVKSSVLNPANCTNETVSLLRKLLAAADDELKPTPRKYTKAVKATSNRRPTRAGTSRATEKVTVFQGRAEPPVPSLSRQEQIALATEVFNISSKTLSEHIKLQPPRPLIREQTKNAATKAPLSPKKPLQPTSPNKTTRPTAEIKKASQRLDKRNTVASGISTIAESAVLALSSLRHLKQSESQKRELNLQLEQGLCILVGKLFAAGLKDMAIGELRILKSRINSYFGEESSRRTSTNGNGPEKLEDLVLIPQIPEDGMVLQLLISFQNLVIRAIIAEGQALTIQKTLDYLILSQPCSPPNLILAAHKAGTITADKAAQQLQALSSTVLSLAALTTPPAEGNTSATKTRVRPAVTVGLQILSMEIRCLWWKIAGHKYDSDKELWSPLARYFTGLARRCPNIKKADFENIKQAFLRLKSSLKLNGHEVRVQNLKSVSLSIVLRILGQLAYTAGCPSEAIEFCKAAAACLTASQPMQLAICCCKIAFFQIEISKGSFSGNIQTIQAAIAEAAKNLSAPLKGNLVDLDELFMEAAKLKKLIMKMTGMVVESVSSDIDGLWLSVVEYMVSFARFLNRYLGPLPLDADADSRNLFMQRLDACRNIAIAAIDSSVALGKISLGTERPSWRSLEPLLTDCFALLNRLNDPCIGDEQTSKSASSSLLRLSNLYWSRYATQKEAGKSPFELVPLLERSINALSHCAPAEQASGFIPIKLERLATIYSEVGHEGKAELNYSSSIRAHIKAGALTFVSGHSAQKPNRDIWKAPESPAFALGRVLSSYIKARLKHVHRTVEFVYDDETLDAECRAALLEHQTTILAEIFAVNPSDTLSQGLVSVISQLLSICPLDGLPYQRSRVVLFTLRLILESTIDPHIGFCQLLAKEAQECLSKLPRLAAGQTSYPYLEDLTTSLRLTLGFYRENLTIDDMQTVVQSWTKMSQTWTTWESVEARIFDTQIWISQLRSLVDYLEVKGHWTLQITVLSIFENVLELQEKRNHSLLVTSLSMIGLQFSRLGLAEKADDALTKAKALIKHQAICPSVVVFWHVVYAEYLIETGDSENSLEILQGAREIFDTSFANIAKNSMRIRNFLDRIGIDAAYLLSRITFAEGKMDQAIFYAKNAVKLSIRLWGRLEKYAGLNKKGDSVKEGVDTIADKLSTLNLSTGSVKLVKGYRTGAIYWPYFSSHCTALRQLSRISAYNGLYQEAVYYGQLALDAAKALGASFIAAFIKAELGSYNIRCNELEKGQQLLEEANSDSATADRSIHKIAVTYHLSALHKYTGELEEEYQMLDECNKALMECFQHENNPLACQLDGRVAEVQNNLEKLTIETKMVSMPQSKAKRNNQPRKPNKRPEKTLATKTTRGQEILRPSLVSQFRCEVLHRQVAAMISSQRFQDASDLLNEIEKLPISKNGLVAQCLHRASLHLNEAVHKLLSHAVYCVLPESCIALLSIQTTGSMSNQPPLTSTAHVSKTPKTPKQSALGSKKPSRLVREDFTDILSTANQSLHSTFPLAVTHDSTMNVHLLSYLTSRVSALSYATSKGGIAVDPSCTVQYKEAGQNSAFLREHCFISADKQLSATPKLSTWPLTPDTSSNSDSLQFSTFTEEYIDILPDKWNVISISLGVERNEFLISKLRAHEAPFMLCLPLRRSDSEDDDETGFSFEDGKQELQEIIRLANKSAHDTRARVDRKAKKEWWANREVLDTRLKDLLHNMENIWFGGFRGIFSQKPKNEVLLSRFVESFEKTLDKHLPSRRTTRGKAKHPRFTLDQNIMELFVNIGKLSDEDDPEESVMDLLYFVVDALQFQGERNAEKREHWLGFKLIDKMERISSIPAATSNRRKISFRLPSLDWMVGRALSRRIQARKSSNKR